MAHRLDRVLCPATRALRLTAQNLVASSRATTCREEGENVLGRVWSHRDLVLSLVRRQYQLRYRQSAVGFAWAIIPPVVTLGVATLVFHRVARVDTGGAPYPVF